MMSDDREWPMPRTWLDQVPFVDLARHVLAQQRGSVAPPLSLEIYPTNNCNLDCIYCWRHELSPEQRRFEDELSAAELLRLLEDALDGGQLRAVNILGGGEPLLRWTDLRPLLDRLARHEIPVRITTNGTLWNSRMADELMASSVFLVVTSLDAADADLADLMRGRGVSASIWRKLDLLVRAREAAGRGPLLTLHALITRETLEQLDRLVELCAARGLDGLEIDSMSHTRSIEGSSRITTLSDKDEGRLAEQLQSCQARAQTLGQQTSFDVYLSRPDLLVRRESQVATDIPCYFPFFHAVIDPRGMLHPCCASLGSSLGSAWQADSTEPYWRQEGLLGLRKTLDSGRDHPICRRCPPALIMFNRAIHREVLRLQAGPPEDG